MAVTTKKTFSAANGSTKSFGPIGIELNNQDDLDVYVTLTGGTRRLSLRQSSDTTATSSHPQVNDTTGLYFPAVSVGDQLYNYSISTDNNNIVFNNNLPSGAVVSCERRTRDSSSNYTNFSGGSTIRSTDLNTAFDESNFTAQEARNKAFELENKIFGGEATSTSFITSDEIVDGTIVDADISTTAEIAVNKLAQGSNNQILQSDNIGNVVWKTNVQLPGTLSVAGSSSFTNAITGLNGAVIDNIYIGINNDNEIDTSSGNLILDSAGGTVTVDDNLTVTGTTTAAAINASGAVNIDGNLAINTNKFNVQSASGNTTIAGTLDVTGTTAFNGQHTISSGALLNNVRIGLDASQEISTASGNLTLDSAGGNVVVDDNLSVNETISANAINAAGAVNVTGNLAINTNKFNVTAANGNTTIAGTLGVTGTINGTLGTNAVPSAAIQDDAVTYAKMQNVSATSKVLGRISSGAGVVEELSAANIKTIYESNSNTNAYIDTHNTLIGGITSSASEINKLDGYTGTATNLNIVSGMTKVVSTDSFPTTSDTAYPTAKRINTHIVSLINDVGGFVPIANEVSFPNANPDPDDGVGTIVSIADAGGLKVADGSGSGTYAGTAGHSIGATTLGGTAVTITDIDTSLRGTEIAAGKGMLVQTTSTLNTYTYHRLTLDEAGVASAQSAITSFNSRYKVHDFNTGNPSNPAEGDLAYDTNANKMKVYDNSTSAWKEVTSVGDFKYLFLCPTGGTGAPTINGSIATYDLREGSNSGSAASVSSAAQLIVSINGVVQRANTGTSAPTDGFALVDSNTIIFGANLATNDSVFIVQVGSTVTLNHPADDSVDADAIDDGAILDVAINGTANIAVSKLADFVPNNADNRVITGSGTKNTLNGESAFTFDGDTLKFTHDAVTNFDSNAQDFLVIENGDSDTYINIGTETNRDSGLIFSDDTRARGWYGYNHSGDYAYIGTAGSERFRIDSSGNIWLNGNGSYNTDRQVFNADGTSGLVEATNELNIFQNKSSSGGLYIGYKDIANGGTITDYHFYNGTGTDTKANISCANLAVANNGGISFAATSDPGGMTNELLDDYEEGTFTPKFGGSDNYSTYHVDGGGFYRKIGNLVYVVCRFNGVTLNASATGTAIVYNLPYAPVMAGSPTAYPQSADWSTLGVAFNSSYNYHWGCSTGYGGCFQGGYSVSDGNWASWPVGDFDSSSWYMDFTAWYST